MNENDKIIGVDLRFTIDSLFYIPSDKPIESEEDKIKLKESIGNISKLITKLISENMHLTEFDDTVCTLDAITYVTPENWEQFYDKVEVWE